jgi:hypothetical protein
VPAEQLFSRSDLELLLSIAAVCSLHRTDLADTLRAFAAELAEWIRVGAPLAITAAIRNAVVGGLFLDPMYQLHDADTRSAGAALLARLYAIDLVPAIAPRPRDVALPVTPSGRAAAIVSDGDAGAAPPALSADEGDLLFAVAGAGDRGLWLGDVGISRVELVGEALRTRGLIEPAALSAVPLYRVTARGRDVVAAAAGQISLLEG